MVIFILGPTASGKTKLSVELAKRINGEIIGADSVQIYKDLVIGAASPSVEERDGIPHHLIGTHDLENEISAGIYIELAGKVIRDIESRGAVAIIVGGTNFYVDALINGLSPVPDLDEDKKKEYVETLADLSTSDLFKKLLEIDPVWAGQISSPNDRQRIIRGLEVAKLTGKILSDWNKLKRIKKFNGDFLAIAIDIERKELYEKINARSEQMVMSGLIDEVKKVNSLGFNSRNSKALGSIGYLETEKYLKGEILSIDELIETIAKNTRHLAKRQLTWLRNREYVRWVMIDSAIDHVTEHMQNRVQNVSKI